ncbi:LysW-gamma-L-alpha-aminoadipyl-6-phosphate/LysW-L-glutamyl-5-phosphate reductase [Phycisphaerales bacterium]|nr:LysW-gamma-L-alpha-aminoadipyl-6-phosphate/LysW-L-glutamyl-5-phosphate reductase [Phycisphaerales bacterium]
MSDRIRASIVGGSGYAGGELLRLLLDHPNVEVAQVTSRRQVGVFVHSVHPNLRGRTKVQFVSPDQLERCDVLFLCLPHGEASKSIERYAALAGRVVDLSADFRLRDRDAYRRWYGEEHAAPAWLDRFVYGLPELERTRLKGARFASGVGCNATAVNMALYPLARKGFIRAAIADLKVGSSEAGAEPGATSHHPERSGSVRSFAPAGHRHQAEVRQELGEFELHMSVTSVELVRGVLCTAHVFPTQKLAEKELWALFREAYRDEPFVRLVKDKTGIHRYPEPKILAGTNWVDVGFELDESTGRVVVMSAIDNLMKGAAGSAVQCMNLMFGFDERAGLSFPGLHPI